VGQDTAYQQNSQVADTQASSTSSTATVRLRGLPFTSTEQDVLAFFAQHDVVDRIADGPKAVSLLLRSNGKPSGQAMVQMRGRADADLTQRVLHGQWMGARYIEVFICGEEGDPGAPGGKPANAEKEGSTSTGAQAAQEPSPNHAATSAAAAAAVAAASVMPGINSTMPGMSGSGMASAPPSWPPMPWGAPGGMAGPDDSNEMSWEALFEFLGPEASAMGPYAGRPPQANGLNGGGTAAAAAV